MGQKKNSDKKSSTATAEETTRQSKSAVTPLRPAQKAAPNSVAKPRPQRTGGPTHEQIAQRAHELWVKSGSIPGQDQKHWLEAEAQLKKELGVR